MSVTSPSSSHSSCISDTSFVLLSPGDDPFAGWQHDEHMRQQRERKDSKNILVVDEDCGIYQPLIDEHHPVDDNDGPSAQSDPRSYLLPMSEYTKNDPYEVYDYQIGSRPTASHGYAAFAPHHSYANDYMTQSSHVPAGLPQASVSLNLLTPAQQYPAHDSTYYGHQTSQYHAYLDATPRPSPTVTSYSPNQGPQGTKVTVCFYSAYDFNGSSPISPTIMFGTKRCPSILVKTGSDNQSFRYALSADAPTLDSPSPRTPLYLSLEGGPVVWDSPNLEFGSFTYLDHPSYYQLDSVEPIPQSSGSKKRKLSADAAVGGPIEKKPALYHYGSASNASSMTPQLGRADVPQNDHGLSRRLSAPVGYPSSYQTSLPSIPVIPQYTGAISSSLPNQGLPTSWSWHQGTSAVVGRAPQASLTPGLSQHSSRTPRLMQSPAVGANNPQLIRTSTIQQPAPNSASSTSGASSFNPFALYPANTKAMLKIDGDLSKMADNWTTAEWETGRRLVQFQRSQSGSLITASFTPVTLETRAMNSICISCIYWAEKRECYVTSVDTISLLESLVGVHFTVEEKNRIRRNLEGFRPLTIVKSREDCEEFFKLIMGFPNPKPRNIEKDVKVFPWRILEGALKKIIGKYSASYSSTAGALHTPGTSAYTGGRAIHTSPDDQRAVSPHSATDSQTSRGNYGYTTAGVSNASAPPVTGLGIVVTSGPDMHLMTTPTAVGNASTTWHPLPASYVPEPTTAHNRAWDVSGYMTNAPTTSSLTHNPSVYQYPHQSTHQAATQLQPQLRMPSITGAIPMTAESRFVPLHGYEGHAQPASSGA